MNGTAIGLFVLTILGIVVFSWLTWDMYLKNGDFGEAYQPILLILLLIAWLAVMINYYFY